MWKSRRYECENWSAQCLVGSDVTAAHCCGCCVCWWCQWLEVVQDLLTQLQSTLEDDLPDTRLLSCRLLRQLFTQTGRRVDRDQLHVMYPCLLKRLDDGSDDVRLAASQTFSAYMQCFHGDYDVLLYRAHLEAIYNGLLIHLDDQHADIQLSVLGNSLLTCLPFDILLMFSCHY